MFGDAMRALEWRRTRFSVLLGLLNALLLLYRSCLVVGGG